MTPPGELHLHYNLRAYQHLILDVETGCLELPIVKDFG